MSISAPPNYGSPDWQRGVYSAQKFLGEFFGGFPSASVNLPPNIETLVIQINGSTFARGPGVLGNQTNLNYPVVALPSGSVTFGSNVWYVDVSSALDTSVTISWSTAPGSIWWAYADAGEHIVADIYKLNNKYGQQYVIPSLPSGQHFDGPLTELELVSGNFTASGNLLPAPPLNARYRLFAIAMQCNNSGSLASLNDGVGGQGLMVVFGGNGMTLTFPGVGYAMGLNNPLYVNVPAFGAYCSAYYINDTP